MSRQILSYADLGPITSVTTPIPGPSSPLPRSPSRDKDSPSEPPRKRLRTNNEEDDSIPIRDANNAAATVHLDGNGNKHKRKFKNLQRRYGNPSGVPWTQHWDAQPRSGVNAGQTLAYEDDDVIVSSSKSMPPPSFIGPVVPSSSAPGKKGKGRNGRVDKTDKVISLANEEEWDDSALIDAWNAAEEEYREMNGGKKWRCEPVKHSSLWHGEFQDDDTDDEPSDNAANDDDDGDLQDSLGVVQGNYGVDETGLGHASGMHLPRLDVPALFGIGATRSAIMEEAFRRAQEASYTAGYWTAVYQMHASQRDPPPIQSPGLEDGEDDSVKGEEEEEGEVFLPSQR